MSSSKPPLLENATRDLAKFAVDIRFKSIPKEVIDRLKTSVLDSIGCCLFGATLPWTQRVQAMVEREGARPVAAIFGTGRQSSIAGAVLVNATAGHAFELDDIHKESIVHPGSIALPVALAFAQRQAMKLVSAWVMQQRCPCSLGAFIHKEPLVSLLQPRRQVICLGLMPCRCSMR